MTMNWVCDPSDEASIACANTCVGMAECEKCNCALVEDSNEDDDKGGPWGKAMDVIFCLLPIAFLLGATLKKKPLPTTTSLPVAAILMFLVRLMYLGSDPLLTCGAVVSGLHEAVSPLTIMFGAIFLFETMEATYCMPYMMREMKGLTNGHPVAEWMILFCFAYMVEGASGFGTPVALGAPMAVSLGFPKFESVVVLLTLNTFATVWGAAGTPIWFGFGNLEGLEEEDFVAISTRASLCVAVAAYILVPYILTYLIPFSVLRQNLIFVFLSLSCCVLPNVGLSFVSYEFPALLGGMVGCILTALLIKCKVGLHHPDSVEVHSKPLGRHPMEMSSSSERSILFGFGRKRVLHLPSLDDADMEDEFHDETPPHKRLRPSNSNVSTGNANSSSSSTVANSRENSEHAPYGVGDIEAPALAAPIDITKSEQEQEAATPENGGNARSKTVTIVVPENTEEQLEEGKSPAAAAAAAESPETYKDDDDEAKDGMDNDTLNLDSHRIVHDTLGPRKSWGEGYLRELLTRTFPIWGTVVLLILTRVPQIGIKDYLVEREDNIFSIHFGSYGIFRLSTGLVLQLENILSNEGLNWKYELLYIPFVMPFVLISAVTMAVYRKHLAHTPREVVCSVAARLRNPAVALLGALCLVQLLIRGGEASPSSLIGTILSDFLGKGWIAFTAYVGILGSFFSGSTTVSNLTFGQIHRIAAQTIGTSETAMLALQSCGGTAGNGVCLNNIIAACAVVGLKVGEGKIIAQTWKPVFAYGAITTIVMLALFFRF